MGHEQSLKSTTTPSSSFPLQLSLILRWYKYTLDYPVYTEIVTSGDFDLIDLNSDKALTDFKAYLDFYFPDEALAAQVHSSLS